MPIYEYRCPNGHTFELFQRMTDPPPSECQICGAAPLEKVLYPAAIHFKGSGFYSTDYGRRGRKKEATQDGEKPDTGAQAKNKPADKVPSDSKKPSKD
jgi:putative FmdB family regulatory protein